jgi:RAT1-interacting protein
LGKYTLSDHRQFSNGATIPTFRADVKLPIDLNIGFKDWSDSSEIPTLNSLFRWISDNNFVTDNIDLLTYRGLLKKIAMTKNDVYKNHWCVRLSKLYSTVIMDEIETEEHKRKRQTESEQQKKFQYYGHRFEKEILLFENDPKESNIVVTSKIGQYRCLFAAEVDGKDKMGNIVEIKTHRELLTDHHQQAFKRSKLLNTYMQCYIAGISQTCFGFRNHKGLITEMKNYSLVDIEKKCVKQWNKDAIMAFLSNVLKWALNQVESGKVYHLQYSGDDHIKLQQVENAKYLPDWFVDHATNCHDDEKV